jgi:hypothetical protein
MADGWVLRISKYLRHADIASITLRGPRIYRERMEEVLREVFPDRTIVRTDRGSDNKRFSFEVRDEKVECDFDNATFGLPDTYCRMTFY